MKRGEWKKARHIFRSPFSILHFPLASAATQRAAGFTAFLRPVSFHFAAMFLFVGTQAFLLLDSLIKKIFDVGFG